MQPTSHLGYSIFNMIIYWFDALTYHNQWYSMIFKCTLEEHHPGPIQNWSRGFTMMQGKESATFDNGSYSEKGTLGVPVCSSVKSMQRSFPDNPLIYYVCYVW